MVEQLQQIEVLSFDEAVVTLDHYRNIERCESARIIFKFPSGMLPTDVINDYYREAKGLGLSVCLDA
jgi:hypothetical protein